MEPTAAALRTVLALAHSAAADGNFGPREQACPGLGHMQERSTRVHALTSEIS